VGGAESPLRRASFRKRALQGRVIQPAVWVTKILQAVKKGFSGTGSELGYVGIR